MTKALRDMLIGVILGDAHIGRTGLDKAFISFEQSKKKAEYLNYLFSISQEAGLVSEEPKTYSRTDQRYNITNESVYFRTKSLESLLPIANTFLDSEGKKTIPLNISEYLTPRSLAFWIMDDGQHIKRGGVTLCTDSFKSEEISILREALQVNFNLITSIHNKKSRSGDTYYERIYINKSSLEELKPQLMEHMHNSMLYKINESPMEESISTTTETSISKKDNDDVSDFGSDIGDL